MSALSNAAERTATVVAAVAVVGGLAVAVEALGIDRRVAWAGVAAVVTAGVATAVWRAWRARRAARTLEGAIVGPSAPQHAGDAALRDRLRAAVRTLRQSRLGQLRGRAALYELPWYIVIGSPAAGKSSAILRSGLDFPFEDDAGRAVAGVGGTRDCDWFFTRDAILLDTAGRYAVHSEDRAEWMRFLGLLKRTRPLAPVNGIVVAASVGDLARASGDGIVELARRLRTRVQELAESLEVVAPVYVVFTKADLIPGFVDFFGDGDGAERERVWGATLACEAPDGDDAATRFGREFDLLRDALDEHVRARLGAGTASPATVLAFPLELVALAPALRSFVATLFDENPFQYRPLFRGFYFTSAFQPAANTAAAGETNARRFGIDLTRRDVATAEGNGADPDASAGVDRGAGGLFLRRLFADVVFGDRALVRQQPAPARRRAVAGVYAASILALSLLLGAWSWAWLANRRLVETTVADLRAAQALQQQRDDLASRLEALERLQGAIGRLDDWRERQPWPVRFAPGRLGPLRHTLSREYFAGIRVLLVQPVAAELETVLAAAGRNGASAAATSPPGPATAPGARRSAPPGAPTPVAGAPASVAGAPRSTPDEAAAGYDALKTYLMLAEPSRRDVAHLTTHVPRHWRRWLDARRGTTPPDDLLRRAQSVAAFALARAGDAAFPTIAARPALVAAARQALRGVLDGVPARERIYAEIVARAAARHPAVSVAAFTGAGGDLVGEGVVPGAYTREAWENGVADAIAEAARGAVRHHDWVLAVAGADDLTLEGGPDAIAAALTARYKAEYVRVWRGFAASLGLRPFGDIADAVERLGRLADPAESPLRQAVDTIHRQTAWDAAPAPVQAGGGVVAWARRALGREAAETPAATGPAANGTIAREFAAVARFVQPAADGASPLDRHLRALGLLRSRLQGWRQRGDAGAGARELVATTLAGDPRSEIAEAARRVDEALAGADTATAAALRPLLASPLEHAFAVAVPAVEEDLNRLWQASVQLPFERQLAARYPFDPASRVEAGADEIGRLFGPTGAIARFADEALAPLAVREADRITPRAWGAHAVRLRPEFVRGLGLWTAAAPSAGAGAVHASATTAFQLLPLASAGLAEYTVTIDGQTLRYRNGSAAWTDFAWPGSVGAPGVRVAGRGPDGREIVFVDAPGAFGLDRAFEQAERARVDDGSRELTWRRDGLAVRIRLRVVRDAGATGAVGGSALRGVKLPSRVAGVDASPPARPTTLAAFGVAR